MDHSHITIDKVTELLQKATYPESVDAALLAIRECSMFSHKELSILANRFIFYHSFSSTNQISSQQIWIKTLNNIQELHVLDKLRQFLENQSDLNTSSRIFDIIFSDIISDPDSPLFILYYNLLLRFLSLVISFESKSVLTIIAQWFIKISKTQDSLIKKITEHIINDHIALAITKSINNLCLISPLFTLCFMTQICSLLENENYVIDPKILQTLVELLTYGLTNSTNILLLTLEQTVTLSENSSLFNFLPSMIRMNVLFPFRSSKSISLCTHYDHFHTSILSFLFSIVTNNTHQNDQNTVLQNKLLPLDYFEQLSISIENIIEHDKSERKSIDECLQRYFQVLSICKNSTLPLTQLSICHLGNSSPLFTHHRLFDVLKHKEEHEMKNIE